jgi:hypothetical protein
MHPPMKQMTTRTPDVDATGSGTNGVDVSENPSLYENLDQVASRVHTTPEQCLMSIAAIARQA